MYSRDEILKKTEKYFVKKGQFTNRVCKLLNDGAFSDVLSSKDLLHLLNEGPGKKIRINALPAQMDTLLKDEIVQRLKIKQEKIERTYWLPGWVDKNAAKLRITEQFSDGCVLFFTGQQSWTDPNKNFPKIIERLEGDLCIVDPFYGDGTFYVLEKFGCDRKIRFLSSKLGAEEERNPTKFQDNFKRFKKEFKNVELRKYDKFWELHDRYIIANNALVVIGHGISNLANKESFVIFLPKSLVSGFLPEVQKQFDQRWKQASNIV